MIAIVAARPVSGLALTKQTRGRMLEVAPQMVPPPNLEQLTTATLLFPDVCDRLFSHLASSQATGGEASNARCSVAPRAFSHPVHSWSRGLYASTIGGK